MARVTVEDCMDKVDSRYELVVLAARRSKDIAAGAPITVSRDNDKNAVVALREIADDTVDVMQLKERLVGSFQNQRARDFEELEHPAENAVEGSDTEVQELMQEAQEQPGVTQDPQQGMDRAGMSFADDNVDVND